MPVSKYFGGKGAEVLRKMKKKYGDKRGTQIFYATINKQKNEGTRRRKKRK